MRSVAMDERCVKMVPEEVKTFNSRLDGSQPIVVLNNNKKNKQIEYKSLRELRNSHVIEHEEIHPIKISGEYQKRNCWRSLGKNFRGFRRMWGSRLEMVPAIIMMWMAFPGRSDLSVR